jgi:DNA repair protein RadC
MTQIWCRLLAIERCHRLSLAMAASLASVSLAPSAERAARSAPHAMAPLFAAFLGDAGVEHAAIAGLDARGCLMSFAEVRGSPHRIADLTSAIRTILAPALVTEIWIAHSHPYAPAAPSLQDRLTTDRVTALARLAGAMLTDHLIFGCDGIYSFSENRLIPVPLRLT